MEGDGLGVMTYEDFLRTSIAAAAGSSESCARHGTWFAGANEDTR